MRHEILKSPPWWRRLVAFVVLTTSLQGLLVRDGKEAKSETVF